MAIEQGFIGLKAAAQWASVSPRTMRGWICDPLDPLPAFRVGGKYLLTPEDLRRWIERRRVQPLDVEAVVEEVVNASRRARSGEDP